MSDWARLPDLLCAFAGSLQLSPPTAPGRRRLVLAGPARAQEDEMILSGLRILLAEDNPTNQLVAAQMLEI